MHENIKERELLEKLGGSGKFKTKLRLQKAMALAGVISNEHTIIPYCARAPDILELRRIFGEDITEGQNKGDLDALGKLTGKQCEPLIERYHPPGTTGVFFKIASKYA